MRRHAHAARLVKAGTRSDCREPRVRPRVKASLELKSSLKQRGDHVAWSVKVTEEYAAWFIALIKDDLASAVQVAQAVAALREEGPALGRPLVDRITGSRLHHLKELRPGSAARSEIRVLFAFDPTRSACCSSAATKLGTGSGGTRRTSRSPRGCTWTTPRKQRSSPSCLSASPWTGRT